jgi:hypothetical protein
MRLKNQRKRIELCFWTVLRINVMRLEEQADMLLEEQHDVRFTDNA